MGQALDSTPSTGKKHNYKISLYNHRLLFPGIERQMPKALHDHPSYSIGFVSLQGDVLAHEFGVRKTQTLELSQELS